MAAYLSINVVAELGCLLIAIFCLVDDKSKIWKGMLLYMLVICATEISGIYVRTQYQSNTWIYNILLIFEISALSLMFQKLLSRYLNCKFIIISGIVVLSTIYVYELSLHGPLKRHYISNVVLGVIMVIYSLYYFYLLLKDETYVNLNTDPGFWWVIGTLFFYFGYTILNIFYPILSKVLTKPGMAFSYTFKILNILLYSCWSYSFICRKWQTTNSKT